MTPEHFQKLAAAGLSVEQIGVVMQIIAESEAASKAAEESRKAGARERVQRWRDKQKEPVTLPKHNGNATVPLTRVEITSSKEEVSGKEQKEERSPKKATRLPADWTIPEHWLQEAIDAGLSHLEAQSSANRMHNWSLSDKKGVKLDWHATWRNWFTRDLPKPPSTASPAPKATTQATMWIDEAREQGLLPNDTPSPTNGRMVARLPAGPNQGPGLARQFAGPRDG